MSSWVRTSIHPSRRQRPRVSLANLSVTAFKTLINPALKKAYASVNGGFIDVTSATGTYTSMKRTVELKPYGKIPAPVATVCRFTWYCSQGNIHAKTIGYTLIGKLVTARYKNIHST